MTLQKTTPLFGARKMITRTPLACLIAFAGLTLAAAASPTHAAMFTLVGPDSSTNDFDTVRIEQPLPDATTGGGKLAIWNREDDKVQVGMANITSTLINAALLSELGPAGSYQINSATLTLVGDKSGVAGATVHELLIPFELTESWNGFGTDPGPDSGDDYDATVIATSTVSDGAFTGSDSTFDLTALVQAYADGSVNTNGLFFNHDGGTPGGVEKRQFANTGGGLGWATLTINAEAVPAPAALPAGLALVGIIAARRRRRIA